MFHPGGKQTEGTDQLSELFKLTMKRIRSASLNVIILPSLMTLDVFSISI